MGKLLVIGFVFAWPCVCFSQEPSVVVVPKPNEPKWVEFKTPAGAQLLLSAGSDKAKWFALDSGCELTAIPGSAIAVFTATKPGRYRAVAVSGEAVLPVTVVVGDSPEPKPKPPEPKPNPPSDPLRDKLKAAFDSDAAQLDKRRDQAADLAALYRQAAKLAGDVEVASSGALLSRVRDAAGMLVGADALREIRKIVGGELGAILPTDATLTDEQRAAVAKLFSRLAVILEELSQ